MTDDDWEGITLLIEEWWKGEWTTRKAIAYRVLLDEYPAPVVVVALRKLANSGKPWMPAAAEIVAAINEDLSTPTWLEVSAWLFCVGRHRLPEPHPAVLEWVRLNGGLQALDMLPIVHPKHGPFERKRLRESWEQFVEVKRARGEHTAALRSVGAPRQLDPLTSLRANEQRAALPEGPAR